MTLMEWICQNFTDHFKPGIYMLATGQRIPGVLKSL